ncbi:urea ABC transporter substrate-binding protein [Candidatus Chloroploca sp. M-50]|uniref:Urea ABC transporter substrate-binding protein n=1 Tax=Candidatus Chloroploca mongolica TaxID=2528176 RepID=A0ABS4D874_9CHLR|nr:urea ABC transporter substrate-binding protein [Candidatus Chloroploca mongolica]MBP1465630.1 urea ABC transporter substrate-binding protein [Candidatus Chloroploca mongolica]
MNEIRCTPFRTTLIFLCFLLVTTSGWGCQFSPTRSAEPIKVGILHSLTGTMAISEQSVSQATLLAIEELNAQGGVLGRRIQPVIRNGASQSDIFAREAEALIVNEHVAVIFGCWTSASRKTVKPIVEQYQHLLFYPVQSEGIEASPNIIYTGAAPNQQIFPAVKWAMDNLGQRFFLIGSDYIFPHAANAMMKDQIRSLRGTIVGEQYVLLGSTEVAGAVEALVRSRPDVILNTLNGDSNVAFFQALRAQGITPQDIPTISFSIAETELETMGSAAVAGDYAAWGYFQSLAGPINAAFVQAYQARYGADAVISDPMEAAYLGVKLWAAAVEQAGSLELNRVRNALHGISLEAPQGAVSIDPISQHLWRTVRIGQIQPDGQFEIVWSSTKPVRPLTYPAYRSVERWEAFLTDLHTRWKGHWQNPATFPSIIEAEP